jgi:hypothetical protein
MSSEAALLLTDVRYDGFGFRRIDHDPRAGRVEVLEVASVLASPTSEQAIRTRAGRFTDGKATMLAPIHRIARSGLTLSVTSAAPEGVTLGDLLGALEFGTVSLSDEAILELASATIGAVAAMHEMPGSPAHGALSPAHVLLCRDGRVLLTGAIFADAMQALQLNREQLWRQFDFAMPPSASLPRFDQRSDVTQLGALVLSMLLRRAMTASEYPKGIADLVTTATAGASGLRMWLQQALQLHAKATLGSAVDAARAFPAPLPDAKGRRPGAQALQAVVAHLCGDVPAKETKPAFVSMPPAAIRAVEMPIRAVEMAPPPPRRGLAFLRSVVRPR